jgi:hypothetical protein
MENPMKGPGNRVKFVIRRQWECPLCRKRLVTPGSVVHQACESCSSDRPGPVWMQMLTEALRAGRKDVPS